MRQAVRTGLWGWLVWLAAACGPGFVERATVVTFDPQDQSFWALPLPCELRQRKPETFGLSHLPGVTSGVPAAWLNQSEVLLGPRWGTNAGAFFTTSGPVDPATLPTSPEAGRSPASSVFLVDVDPSSPEHGRRFPLTAQLAPEGDSLSPPGLLAVLPALWAPRRPSTRYAVVLTEALHDAAGAPLGRSRAFHQAFESGALSELRMALERQQVSSAQVVAATAYSTVDPAEDWDRLARWADQQPVPVRELPWTVAQELPDFTLLTSSVQLPQLQSGTPPYLGFGEGLISWDGGEPVPRGEQSVRVALSIPRSAMPDAGFPVTLYVHGTGGDVRQFVDRGPRPELPGEQQVVPDAGTGPAAWLARSGSAAFSHDLPLHGTRSSPAETSGLLFTNLQGDLRVARNNRLVASLELLLLSRFVASQAGAALPIAGARLDVSRLGAVTQSLGSTVGLPWIAREPSLRAAVISGASGSLIEQVVKSAPLLSTLVGVSEASLHRGQPLLHVLQSLAEPVDPLNTATQVRTHGLASLFMVAGFEDDHLTPEAQSALAGALGLTVVGQAVDQRLASVTAASGAGSSLDVIQGNWAQRTGGVVQVAAPSALGHHVLFNRTEVQHLVTCFLLGPGHPIAPLTAATGPCP
ncbi:MAG: hypothetical protein K1X89_17475 [Myxococcaceae bacterium]|nr:hypothetical protein [Myxococcaceae bacterium]